MACFDQKQDTVPITSKDFILCPEEPDFKPVYQTKEVNNIGEVKQVIIDAKNSGKIVRTHGSNHSPQDHIISNDEEGILLTLKGDLQQITLMEKNDDYLKCEVGAGCFLGNSPGNADWKDSLCKFVDDNGFAIPILGGISFQTVSGFLMTASSGGSLKYGIGDVVIGITFVDGTGEVHECNKKNSEDVDLFNAVGVSMGLFGIITSVKFKFTDRSFMVKGKEENVDWKDSFLFDEQTLDDSLTDVNNEYYHLNWFPQEKVNRVMQWTGKRVTNDNPLEEYEHTLKRKLVAKFACAALKASNFVLYEHVTPAAYDIIGWLLNPFVSGSTKNFCDYWYHAIPSDNDIYGLDSFMKVDFTEVWVPRSKYADVLEKLKRLYSKDDDGQKAAGTFATEIYCAKKSPFWLSMSYGSDMLRIDPFWFHGNPCGDKREFFSHIWNTLLGIEGARLHWGKYLPLPGQTCGEVTFNLNFLKKNYEKMDEWLEMRKKMDPHQVFVNKFWRGILEIPKPDPLFSTSE